MGNKPATTARKRLGYQTVTVSMAVYTRLETWRDDVLERGVDSLPVSMRAPMRAALHRVDGRHKGLVGLGAVLGVMFDACLDLLTPPPPNSPAIDATASPLIRPSGPLSGPTEEDWERWPLTGKPGSIQSIASLDADLKAANPETPIITQRAPVETLAGSDSLPFPVHISPELAGKVKPHTPFDHSEQTPPVVTAIAFGPPPARKKRR